MKIPQYKLPAAKNFSYKEFTALNPNIRTRLQSSCLDRSLADKTIVRVSRGYYSRTDNTYPDIAPKHFPRKQYHHRDSQLILPVTRWGFKPIEIIRLNPGMSHGLIYSHITNEIKEGRLVRIHRNKYRHNSYGDQKVTTPKVTTPKVTTPKVEVETSKVMTPKIYNMISDEVLMNLIRTGVLKIVAA